MYPTNISKIYPRYIQDIQDKYKIPGPRGPGLGPGQAGSRLVFCVYLGYLGDILDISRIYFWDICLIYFLVYVWYNFGICLVYFWYTFGICLIYFWLIQLFTYHLM